MQIDITNLHKRYKKQIIFDEFNLTLNNKQINFLVGANGTGKSTFLKCLLKLIKYQGRISGHDVAIAYMPERLMLPDYVKVKAFLKLIGAVRGISSDILNQRITEYLKKFNMLEHQEKSIIQLSKGMRQKVLLIQTLMSDADLYIFDEPLNGLDQKSQQVFMNEIGLLRKKEKLIIITTHQINSYRFRNKRIIDFNQIDFIKNGYETNQTSL